MVRRHQRLPSRLEASRICAGCPVKAACESFAESSNQQHGSWGDIRCVTPALRDAPPRRPTCRKGIRGRTTAPAGGSGLLTGIWSGSAGRATWIGSGNAARRLRHESDCACRLPGLSTAHRINRIHGPCVAASG
ncbi:hypothetical protein GS491_23535 [Rhodococcus hoagii]|nr:hypothetical protein [Prescottella equi]